MISQNAQRRSLTLPPAPGPQSLAPTRKNANGSVAVERVQVLEEEGDALLEAARAARPRSRAGALARLASSSPAARSSSSERATSRSIVPEGASLPLAHEVEQRGPARRGRDATT